MENMKESCVFQGRFPGRGDIRVEMSDEWESPLRRTKGRGFCAEVPTLGECTENKSLV